MKNIKILFQLTIAFLISHSATSQIKMVTGGDVGIGTSSPNTGKKLEVFGNQIITGIGNGIFFDNNDRFIGTKISTGNFTLQSKNLNWLEISSGSSIAFHTTQNPTSSNFNMFLSSDGLGIGLGWQAYSGVSLAVGGNIYTSGIYQGSDIRFKNDINPIQSALSKVLSLKGKSYFFNTEEFENYNFDSGLNYGFIAQEIAEVMPNLVHASPEEYLSVNYIGIIPFLVEAIKEQQIQIENLEKSNKPINYSTRGISENSRSTTNFSANKIIPNPNNGQFKYVFNSEIETSCEIKVITIDGGLVFPQIRFDVRKGKNSIDIKLNETNSSGTYILIVNLEEEIILEKFMVE